MAIAAVGSVACTSEEEQKKEDAAKAEAAAKEAFTSDYCEIVLECCNRVLSLPKDTATCKTRITALDPAMLGDAKARTDCLAQLRKVAARDDFCSEFGNHEQPACPDVSRKPLTGAKKPGEACAADAECEPSFDGTVSCKSVCQVKKRGKDGDGPCVATVEGDITVAAKEEATGPDAFVCYLTRDELVCDEATKKCIKPVALNAECTDSNLCVRTAYCDSETKKCLTKKANGNSCTDGGDQCQGHCADGFCAANAKEGEACADTSFCVAELECSGGKCAKPAEDPRLTASCVDSK